MYIEGRVLHYLYFSSWLIDPKRTQNLETNPVILVDKLPPQAYFSRGAGKGRCGSCQFDLD